jgi:DNA-directed RNA polymerase subunit RPC12/RpoP
MASPVITCPKCVKKFKGRDDLAGKKIKCPFCAHPFVVPAETAIKQAAPVSGPAAKESAKPAAAMNAPIPFADEKNKRVGWDEEDEDQNPYGITHLDLTPRCPHCAKELLSADAVVCVYCGYNTLTRKHGETKKILETSGHDHLMHLMPGLLAAGGILFLIILVGVFSLAWPDWVAGGTLDFSDHESLRMWFAVIAGFVCFGLGRFAYKRIILEPKPPERVKD